MKKIHAIKKIIYVIIFLYVAYLICEATPYYTNLVDYGDKIRIVIDDIEETNNLPDEVILQNDEVLLSVETINQYIDSGMYVTDELVKTNHDKYIVNLPIDSNVAKINTEEKLMNAYTTKISGDVYVPIEALEEVYDIKVDYNEKVIISTEARYEYSKGVVAKNAKLKRYKREKSGTVTKVKKGDEIEILTSDYNILPKNEYIYVRTKKGELGFIKKKNLKLEEMENRIFIDGVEQTRKLTNDVKIVNDQVMLSLDTAQRFIDEYIYFDKNFNTVIAIHNDKVVKLPVSKNIITENDIEKMIKEPVQYIDNVLYLPLDELKNIYQLEVEQTSIISINKNSKINLTSFEETPKVSLVWEYAENFTPDRTSERKNDSINVVSPTWLYASDEFGRIKDVTSSAYVSWARSNSYEIWPTIKNDYLGIEKTSQLVTNMENRKKFIDNIVEICEKYNFEGINLDFEHMYQRDRDEYVMLVRELAAMLKQKGIITSVDVNVPDGSSEWSLCYASKAISDSCDYIILMAYDQYGKNSSIAGPVAGLNWVERNLQKMIERDLIASSKLILGIPFYSRQWKIKNGSVYNTTALSMSTAETQRFNKSSDTIWDEELGQYVISYETGGTTVKTYVENKDSLREKMKLIEKYDLAGVAAWRRGFEINEVWQVIGDAIK